MKTLSTMAVVLCVLCLAPGASLKLRAADAAAPALTEDFESGQIDLSKWRLVTNGAATIEVQTNEVAHGKYALKVHYPMGPRGYAFIIASNLSDSVKEHHFGSCVRQA